MQTTCHISIHQYVSVIFHIVIKVFKSSLRENLTGRDPKLILLYDGTLFQRRRKECKSNRRYHHHRRRSLIIRSFKTFYNKLACSNRDGHELFTVWKFIVAASFGPISSMVRPTSSTVTLNTLYGSFQSTRHGQLAPELGLAYT